MESRTVLNMETTRKAFSAVTGCPVSPNTRKVTSWISLEAVKKKLILKARKLQVFLMTLISPLF